MRTGLTVFFLTLAIAGAAALYLCCLLYTSDAADE